AVPEGLSLGRHAPGSALHGRLPRGTARAPAHHALRAGRVLSQSDLLGRGPSPGSRRHHAVTRPRAAAFVLAFAGPALGAGPPGHGHAVAPSDLAYVYGAGRFVPEYAPPPPGSYRLPPIDDIADHPLLRSDGRRTTLYALTGERVAVVAFIYTSCAEATGCPV